MTARYCPNCDCIKEVISEQRDGEEVNLCLTCDKTFSYTIKRRRRPTK